MFVRNLEDERERGKRERKRRGVEGNESDLIGVALSGASQRCSTFVLLPRVEDSEKKQPQQKQPNNRTGKRKRFLNKKSAAFFLFFLPLPENQAPHANPCLLFLTA